MIPRQHRTHPRHAGQPKGHPQEPGTASGTRPPTRNQRVHQKGTDQQSTQSGLISSSRVPTPTPNPTKKKHNPHTRQPKEHQEKKKTENKHTIETRHDRQTKEHKGARLGTVSGTRPLGILNRFLARRTSLLSPMCSNVTFIVNKCDPRQVNSLTHAVWLQKANNVKQ